MPLSDHFRTVLCGLLLAGTALLLSQPARAQEQPALAETSQQPLTLTLETALQIALEENYTLRDRRLDVENAGAQVREAWGQVFPQVSASASYTRNVVTANPFAGSDISGLFGGGNAGDWVAFNERARTDDDPATQPITFDEFQRRQREARGAAGIGFGGSSNPFGVDNQFFGGISVEQTLFNGSAFAAIAGAQQLKDVNQRGLDRQQQVLIDNVREAFYQTLLVQEQARVAAQSVERTAETLHEVSLQVERGVTPKFQRLSAEVELANLETQLVQARNQAGQALDNLKMALGLPVEQPIELRGTLAPEERGEFLNVSVENAVGLALENRPDLEQARLAVELREIDKNITQAQRLPQLSAFANFDYTGRVPDDRTRIVTNPNDPFFYDTNTLDFFSDEYWNPSVNVGLRLSWNIFSGFQTSAQAQQRQVAINRAELTYEQLLQQVQLEVQTALRNLQTARERIRSQEQNVERAETNYTFANQRVSEGVSNQLELREASQQLDQSRLNYLQAVYDYLVAKSAFETAVGLPTAGPDAFQFTSN